MKNITLIFAICALGFACSENSDVARDESSASRDTLTGEAVGTWDVDSGKLVATWCSGCHGEDGTSKNRYIPHLAGQRMAYVIEVLEAYKEGARDNPEMRAVVTALTEEAKVEVAAYYAGRNSDLDSRAEPALDRKLETEREPSLPLLKWAPACNRCHDENEYTEPGSRPVLVGQREDYLTYALHTYQNRFLRDSSMMHAMTELLTNQEIRDLAAYYAERESPSRVGETPPERLGENEATEE